MLNKKEDEYERCAQFCRRLGIRIQEDVLLEEIKEIENFIKENNSYPSRTSNNIQEKRLAEIVEYFKSGAEFTLDDYKYLQDRFRNLGFNIVEIKTAPVWDTDNTYMEFDFRDGYIVLCVQQKHTIRLIESLYGKESMTRFFMETLGELFIFKKPKNASLKKCKKAIFSDNEETLVQFYTDFKLYGMDFEFVRYHMPHVSLKDTPVFDLDRWKEEFKQLQPRLDEWKL